MQQYWAVSELLEPFDYARHDARGAGTAGFGGNIYED